MSKELEIDPQDPLPESAWTWRRTFVFLTSIILLGILWENLSEIGEVAKASAGGSETAIAGQVVITKYVLGAFALNQLFYLVAPSAEQITRIIQAANAMKAGVRFTQTHTKTEHVEEEFATAGKEEPGLEEADVAPTSRG